MSEKFEGGMPPQEQKKVENPKEQKEQRERLGVMENFEGLLEKKPECYHYNGSIGVFHNEDIVCLSWQGEEGKEPKNVRLGQKGEIRSDYADSRTVCYETDLTVIQIAKIIAEKGIPAKIDYIRIDMIRRPGKDYKDVDKRQSAEFDFSEVEAKVLKSARALAPEYAEMSLEEIGNALREKEAQERHKEIVEKFKGILGKKPEYNYHDSSLGVSRSEDGVVLVFEGEEGKKETIRLDQEGQSSSDYAYSQPQSYEADPTVIQIAKIIAERGIPKSVIYTRADINDWPGSNYENEQISGAMGFSEVEAEVLKSARALAPEYKEMSLEEIGNALREKEVTKE